MSQMDIIYSILKSDLEAPRVLLEQVVNAISAHSSLTTAEFDQFFSEVFPTLEDYQVDLLFSPQYTPAEHNRLEYMPALGVSALSPAEVLTLKRKLNDAHLTTELKTPDGQWNGTVPIHEMFIDRYVNLLKLDQAVPASLVDALSQYVPSTSRNEMSLLAREDAWRTENRQDILLAFLKVFDATHTFSTLKASFLTNFVRTYRTHSLLDVERQLDSLIQSCKTDMDSVGGRGFQDEYLRSLHGRNPQNTAGEKDVWAHYKHMMDMGEQLKADYQHIAESSPELLAKAKNQQPV